MKCPVCNRNLAPSLSICLTCGTMMNDSVREELHTKVATVAQPQRIERQAAPPVMKKPPLPEVTPVQRPRPAKVVTTELESAKTSKTLVEFQTKNATLPDWRLQVQNAVRQRSGGPRRNDRSGEPSDAIYQKQLVTNGANALKPEPEEHTEPAESALHCDPRVANALKRIAESRKTFLHEEVSEPAKPADSRNYPFNIVSRSSAAPSKPSDGKASINVLPKPKLVSTYKIEKKKFDTNKLPPLPKAIEPQRHVAESEEIKEKIAYETAIPMPDILPVVEYVSEAEMADPAIEADEIDDLAPFALRFNAGLFDMIIGVFASLILLSPIVFLGGNWFSLPGTFALIAACSIVMFVYLTVFIGLWGKTIGMRIFSLELVDAEENEYPTFHQAAVSAAVYLATLPLAGAGFLTVLFNEERRAAHDLASGTIVVTEF